MYYVHALCLDYSDNDDISSANLPLCKTTVKSLSYIFDINDHTDSYTKNLCVICSRYTRRNPDLAFLSYSFLPFHSLRQ